MNLGFLGIAAEWPILTQNTHTPSQCKPSYPFTANLDLLTYRTNMDDQVDHISPSLNAHSLRHIDGAKLA